MFGPRLRTAVEADSVEWEHDGAHRPSSLSPFIAVCDHDTHLLRYAVECRHHRKNQINSGQAPGFVRLFRFFGQHTAGLTW